MYSGNKAGFDKLIRQDFPKYLNDLSVRKKQMEQKKRYVTKERIMYNLFIVKIHSIDGLLFNKPLLCFINTCSTNKLIQQR